jgi:thiosulfate/3-mercaptopyruvate sulfurtransferase
MHDVHNGELSCYVCHSVRYKNCYGCHVGLDEKGRPYRITEKSELDFKIGLNPDKASETKYVLLRHVPLAEDSYDFYTQDVFPKFSASPVWKPTTPHNIQKFTPQNFGCNSCHGKEKLFLTTEDLLPGEEGANAPVVLSKEDIPQQIKR